MGLFDMGFDTESSFQVSPAKANDETDSALFGLNGAIKRALDLALVIPALLFLLPVFAIIAILIKVEGGPLLYRQIRIGRDGQRFSMLKFRTMQVDAEQRLVRMIAHCPDTKAEWDAFQKLRRDPRVTRCGDFLRRTSLDELPQLLNILMGDMSVVGQRPILPSQRDAYGLHIYGYERARPGLTGLWQVSGRNSLTFEDRAALGSDYINRWSLWLDIKLILLTVPTVLFSRDAF
ncbi:MAG: sugar transferase [Henriciella sp.]|jgi:lipopolysaccharide/colanic/teichoic acid biosynthesis glycosyltransferase